MNSNLKLLHLDELKFAEKYFPVLQPSPHRSVKALSYPVILQ